MNWSKFFSREFLYAMALTTVATVAMFYGRATFVEWAAASGGFAGYWMTTLTVQKVKGVSAPPKE
jgi:hypothetical protein